MHFIGGKDSKRRKYQIREWEERKNKNKNEWSKSLFMELIQITKNHFSHDLPD